MKKPPEVLKKTPGNAMTDRECQCGCGRKLRKNNVSGYSGYCNTAKYQGGERAPRASRSKTKPSEPSGPWIAFGTTKVQGLAIENPPPSPEVVLLTDDELAEIAVNAANEIHRRIGKLQDALSRLEQARTAA